MFNFRILILVLSAFILGSPFNPEPKICCTIPATDLFAGLANYKEFVALHDNPMPFSYQTQAGKMITFAVSDGKNANAFYIAAKKPSNKVLFVFHEWWGLNDYIKQESEKYYNEFNGKYNVIAIDLYDGQVATTREEAGKYIQSVNTERANAIISGAIKFSTTDKNPEIATIGWCFGGGWSLQAALIAKMQAKACVIYYGMPEKDVEKLKNLEAKVLGIFAAQEKRISPEVVKEFESNMGKANKKVTIKSFDADHAFANPSNPKYNKEFGDEAFKMSVKFIKKNL